MADRGAARVGQVVRQDTGATATEYGLLVAFVALAIVLGVTLFGGALNSVFTDLANKVGLL
ncbi:MAG: Flp family type IVb pilin [Jatrophihabitantaceae bacterium]